MVSVLVTVTSATLNNSLSSVIRNFISDASVLVNLNLKRGFLGNFVSISSYTHCGISPLTTSIVRNP